MDCCKQSFHPLAVCNNNKVSGSLLHLMIMYMDCTGHSGLQFYCWFGMDLRKVSVECTCQEFQVRLTLKKCVALSNYAEIYAPYTKIIILNFTGGLVVCFCALNCFSVTLFAAQVKQAQGHQLRQEACWLCCMGRLYRSITGQHSRSAEVYKYLRYSLMDPSPFWPRGESFSAYMYNDVYPVATSDILRCAPKWPLVKIT